eukprot:m51a1_g13550 putative C-tail anchored protein (70) ;mRNA; r:1893-2175
MQTTDKYPAAVWASATDVHVVYPFGSSFSKQTELIIITVGAATLGSIIIAFFAVVIWKRRRGDYAILRD